MKIIATNRKAYHDFTISETVEAGLALTGTEIKSIRAGRVNLKDAYAKLEKGELWLFNMHIAPYEAGSRYNHDPYRPRKLLLHRDEVDYFGGKVEEKGLALVPLKLYIKGHVAKLELGLAKGKKLYDKRRSIAQRDAEREMQRTLRREMTRPL